MAATTETNSVQDRRAEAVKKAVARIHDIAGGSGVDRSSLEEIRAELYQLAAQSELFPADDFPVPTDGDTTRRYVLSEDPDQTYAPT